MPSSPKRKSETTTPADSDSEAHKKARVENTAHSSTTSLASETPLPDPSLPPDANINPSLALAYWSSTSPTVSGVLGGFPQVSRVDLQGSSNFLAKLRRGSKAFPPEGGKLRRAVDCGAGIGRITERVLLKVAERVDVVEPVERFTDVLAGREGVGRVWNVGLEEWHPEAEGEEPYDLIWTQWCLGQLKDRQAVEYLRRVQRPRVLSEGGWVVVKENLSNHHLGEDVYDEVDSSVTRTDTKFRLLFEEAGLKVVSTEVQRGMPKGLYPVRTYALQPK